MSSFKKGTSYILMIALLCAFLVVDLCEVAQAASETHFADDFQSGYSDGDILTTVTAKYANVMSYTGADKWGLARNDANGTIKIISEPNSTNMVLDVTATGSVTSYAYKTVANGANKLLRVDFRVKTFGTNAFIDMRNTTSGTSCNLIYLTGNSIRKYNNSSTQVPVGTIDPNEFESISLIVNVVDWTVDIYQNGSYLTTGTPGVANPSLPFDTTLFGFKITGTAGTTKEAWYDDIKISSYPNFTYEISNGATSEVDINAKLDINFSNGVDGDTLIPTNIQVNDGQGNNTAIRSVTQDVDNKDKCTIEFANPLNYDTTYTVTMPGVKDEIGRISVQSAQFTTRSRMLIVKSPQLYKGVISDENVVESLTAGFVTGAVEIDNEKGSSYPATIMMILYDNEGSVRNISCAKTTIEPFSDGTISTQFTAESVPGGMLKIFLWDSLEGMYTMVNAREYH